VDVKGWAEKILTILSALLVFLYGFMQFEKFTFA